MALESTQLARPSARVFTSTGDISPETITIQASVNAFPRATITYHDTQATGSTRSMIPSDMSSKMAADQSRMFEATPGTSVFVDDGLGGRLAFSGYTSSSMYEIMASGVGQSAAIVHSSALLDSLQTAIYRFSESSHRHVDEAAVGSSTYTSWMSAVLDKIMEKWAEGMSDALLDSESREIAEIAHNNNEGALALWRQVLNASTDETEHLSKFAQGTMMGFRNSLNGAISSIYFGGFGSFLQAMQQFGLQFQLVYVPSLDQSGAGKFIRISDMLTEGEEKEAHISQMAISAGMRGLIPVTQVMVYGATSTERREGTSRAPKFIPAPGLSVFPPDAASGRVYITSAPPWLPTIVHATIQDVPDPDPGMGPPDIDRYRRIKTNQDKNVRKYLDTTVRDVLDEWTKNMYADMALADATAQLSVPLDLTWEIGKVYKVTAKGAKGEGSRPLFTGFLAGIGHSLASTHESPRASTTLNFTHVRGEGFTLPGF